eukprot:5221175-Prymnesium_polylepis.2
MKPICPPRMLSGAALRTASTFAFSKKREKGGLTLPSSTWCMSLLPCASISTLDTFSTVMRTARASLIAAASIITS